MATKTTNYGLEKPDGTDFYDVDVQNSNMDIIDKQMKANANAITQLNSDKVDKADKANVKWIITGIDTSAKIIFSNCSEITKKVDKLACLLFGDSNGTTVLSVIRIHFSDGHVDEAVPINFGNLNLTTSLEWYGFTLNNLNAYGNYVLIAPPGCYFE